MWVPASLPGTRTGRIQRELSLKTERDRIGQLDPLSLKKTLWAGIMEVELEEPPASGVVVQVEVVSSAPVMVVVQAGDHLQLTSPHKVAAAVAGVRTLMVGHSKHQELLSGRMIVQPWAGGLMMVQAFGDRREEEEQEVEVVLGGSLAHQVDGRTCLFQILGREDHQGQEGGCHQGQE